MSVLTDLRTKASTSNAAGTVQGWLSPLNLHWAGVGLLALVNIYLLAQMGLLWHAKIYYDADARAQQRIELKAAQVAAQPLRGLDAKVLLATREADTFTRDRLPATDSEMLSELGALAAKQGVRLIRVQYVFSPVLAGSSDELSELRMDASLSGDYRPLMQFINSLERDKMFFVIKGVALTGQQSGTVNLRMRLTTYLRQDGTRPVGPGGAGSASESVAAVAAPAAGGVR